MGKRLAWSESTWFQWTQLAAGLLLGALGYRMFLVPNDIAAGGFTGIGQLVNHFLSWPVGAVALALNVPLFALSMGRLGLKFGLKSLLASVALSLLIDHLPVGPFTRDPILAAIFGGVVAGAGFGLVLRGGHHRRVGHAGQAGEQPGAGGHRGRGDLYGGRPGHRL